MLNCNGKVIKTEAKGAHLCPNVNSDILLDASYPFTPCVNVDIHNARHCSNDVTASFSNYIVQHSMEVLCEILQIQIYLGCVYHDVK